MVVGDQQNAGMYSEAEIRELAAQSSQFVIDQDNQRPSWWFWPVWFGGLSLYSFVMEVGDATHLSEVRSSLFYGVLAGVITLMGMILIHILVRQWKRHYQLKLRAQLAQSNLASRLLAGEFVDDSIFRHTPWPWRLKLQGKHARDLKTISSRISSNLDWYLKPRRVYFRLVSRLGLLCLPLLILIAGLAWLEVRLILTVFVLSIVVFLELIIATYTAWWRESCAYFAASLPAEQLPE